MARSELMRLFTPRLLLAAAVAAGAMAVTARAATLTADPSESFANATDAPTALAGRLEVMRSGVQIASSATRPFVVPNPRKPTVAGIDINHALGSPADCWVDVTPAMRRGDTLRLVQSDGSVTAMTIGDVNVTAIRAAASNTAVEVTGIALLPDGVTPVPAAELGATIRTRSRIHGSTPRLHPLVASPSTIPARSSRPFRCQRTSASPRHSPQTWSPQHGRPPWGMQRRRRLEDSPGRSHRVGYFQIRHHPSRRDPSA